MASSDSGWITIAHILRPQGRRGEVLAELHTDFPDRFSDRRSLTLLDSSGLSSSPVQLESHWLPVGNNAGRVVLKFQGIDSISDAEKIAGKNVVISEEQRVPLEDGAFYVSDLIGCAIIAEDRDPDTVLGKALGTVSDVHFPASASGARQPDAVPILVVHRPNGDELLIPLAKAFLHKPDLANKRIEVRLPPGLLEING